MAELTDDTAGLPLAALGPSVADLVAECGDRLWMSENVPPVLESQAQIFAPPLPANLKGTTSQAVFSRKAYWTSVVCQRATQLPFSLDLDALIQVLSRGGPDAIRRRNGIHPWCVNRPLKRRGEPAVDPARKSKIREFLDVHNYARKRSFWSDAAGVGSFPTRLPTAFDMYMFFILGSHRISNAAQFDGELIHFCFTRKMLDQIVWARL